MRAFPPPSSGTARLVSREAAVGCNSLDGRSLLLDPCVSPAGVEDPATSTNLDKSIGRPDADVYLRCADCVLCLHQAAKRMRSTQVGLSRGTSAGYSEICRSAQQTLSVVPMYVRDPTDGRPGETKQTARPTSTRSCMSTSPRTRYTGPTARPRPSHTHYRYLASWPLAHSWGERLPHALCAHMSR